MNEQMIINQAVDTYHRLDRILSNQVLKNEETAFLRGRMLELMLLICALDEQAIVRLLERPVETELETVSDIKLIRISLN
jgi:hypothetical protein